MKILIKNYMCHRNLDISFSSLAVLTGTNGSGKSAIFHAIHWLIHGGKNNFITDGENSSSVKIITEKFTVERYCKGTKYFVYLDGKEVGTTKEPLENLIRIDLKLVLYSQFDSIYLLSDKPGERINILNELFDIENIEKGLSDISKDITSLKSSVDSNQVKLDSKLDDLDALSKITLDGSIIKSELEVSNNLHLLLKNLKVIQHVIPDKLDYDVTIFSRLYRLSVDIKFLSSIKDLTCKVTVAKLNDIRSVLKELIRYKEKISLNAIKLLDSLSTDCESIYKSLSMLNQLKSLNKYDFTLHRINSTAEYFTLEKLKEYKEKLLHCNIEVTKITDSSSDIYDSVKTLRNLKKKINMYHASEDELSGYSDELSDIDNELKGQACPLCKKQIGG